jgi:hypothetical protein
MDGPGKSFQSVKRGCVIDNDDLSFAVITQDRTQFSQDDSREKQEKQLRTFATKFQLIRGETDLEQERWEEIKKLSFRLCYFSMCPKSGLGANRLPMVITYAKRLMKYVRCSCKVGQNHLVPKAVSEAKEVEQIPLVPVETDAKMKDESANPQQLNNDFPEAIDLDANFMMPSLVEAGEGDEEMLQIDYDKPLQTLEGKPEYVKAS